MLLEKIFILATALFVLVKGADLAIRYAVGLAESFALSKYVVGFIVVAVVSILPETFVSLSAAWQGTPEFGLAVLFGSNVADLTIAFAAIMALTGRGIRIESKIIRDSAIFPFILFLPIALGLNGHYSRWEGLALILAGIAFYYLVSKKKVEESPVPGLEEGRGKNALRFLGSMALLLIGAHFAVSAAVDIASALGISSIIIGMFIVSLGTVMPEFLFSLRSIEKRHDTLAIGDILGTVLADATVVVGILALISPFYFPVRIVYITGLFMVLVSICLLLFMRSGRTLSRKEGRILLLLWLAFVIVEYTVSSTALP